MTAASALIHHCTPDGSHTTYTLPTPATSIGKRYVFVKSGASNNMIITGAANSMHGMVADNGVFVDGDSSTTATFTGGAVDDWFVAENASGTGWMVSGFASGDTFAFS